MPKTIVSYQFAIGATPYVTDAGQDITLSGRFVAPPDYTRAEAEALAALTGASVLTEGSICSDNALGKGRKLQFIRASGNSVSFIVPTTANILALATSIRANLDGSGAANNQVVCIKLFGEEFQNLNDPFGLNWDGTTTATSHKAPAAALKQNFASGVIQYEAHAATPVGAGVTLAIKSITESADNVLAAQLGGAGATCIGDFLEIQNCGNGRRNPRKHRRYILTFAVPNVSGTPTDPVQSESIEVPVKDHEANAIFQCGQQLAALPGLFCIGYKGEDYSRVHHLL